MPSTEPDSAELLERLRTRVRLDEPGERLPSERRLAREHGVGRAVVRQALRELDMAGLVRTRRQSGTYIEEQRGAVG
jgi:GntR family transcriptional repressor for pyruvate dehydrogenase complex